MKIVTDLERIGDQADGSMYSRDLQRAVRNRAVNEKTTPHRVLL